MSDSPQSKRVEEMPIDRLSSLPDPILLHILSFLGVKKAAVTSLLSKRWEFTWAQLPSLVFIEESKDTAKIREFVSAINRTLGVRNGIHLERFSVNVCYDNSLALDVDFWVDSALQNKTNIFALNLVTRTRRDDDLYTLPEKMYSNPSFTCLRLEGFVMDTSRTVEWKSLASLNLINTKLAHHVIENILSGCPLLHILILCGCWGFNCLKVNTQCLHHLQVYENGLEENGSSLEISAPYLQKLGILFYPQGRTMNLKNTTSLLEAEINFIGHSDSNHEEVMNTTKEIYDRIQHVNDIRLETNYFKLISELVVNGWKMPISRRSILTISADVNEQSVAGVIQMLESSPNLKEFLLQGFSSNMETGNQAPRCDLNCDLLYLKYVKIRVYSFRNCDWDPMLAVAESLLKRAVVLEEMSMVLKIPEASEHDEVVQRLFALAKSSEKAVIRIHLIM